jgi:N-acetylmuramoyl-L-alanine amidase
MATRIFIVAGHGGTDPGASGSGTNERDFLEPLVDKAVAKARTQLAPEHEVVTVPHSYNYIEAVNYFNRVAGPLDILAEIHLNSNAGTPGTGTETYYGLKSFAMTFQDALVKGLGLANRGIKYSDAFYVTTGAISGGEKSGIIAELGFVNNNNDVQVLRAKGEDALASAIISTSYGRYVAYQPSTPPAPVQPDYIVNDAPFIKPREMVALRDTYVIDFKTGKNAVGNPFITKGIKVSMVRITKYQNEIYYRSRYAVEKNLWQGLKASDFGELPDIEPIPEPPTPPASTIPEDYAKQNNALLHKLVELVQQIISKLTNVFK